MIAVNPPCSPGTDAAEDVGARAPGLEVRRLGHRDEAGTGRRRVGIPDSVRVAHNARVGEICVESSAIANGTLYRRRKREGGDNTEEC